MPHFLALVAAYIPTALAAQPLFGAGAEGLPDLAARWQLDEADEGRQWRLMTHEPIYFLPLRVTSDINVRPVSGNPETAVPEPTDYSQLEAKFQFSFKFKLADGLFAGHGDVWALYTQRVFWQAFAQDLSYPIRETVYMPAFLLNFALDGELLGWRPRMTGIGFAHTSNGRPLPLSRAFNRLSAHFAAERGPWVVALRPWVRVPGQGEENPEILDYIGRCELEIGYGRGAHRVSFLGRHPLTFDPWDRGYAALDYSVDLAGRINLFTQLATGYGETLLDYNHAQTTAAVGVAFWGG